MGAPDWKSIQAEYEQGVSLRTLSAKYGVGKSTIHERATSLHWHRPDITRTDGHRTDTGRTSEEPLPTTPEIASLAQQMVGQLAQIAETPLELKEHSIFARALNEYNRIIVTTPPAGQDDLPGNVDWSIFTPDELAIIQPIFEAAEARRAAELEQQNITPLITPLRKQA